MCSTLVAGAWLGCLAGAQSQPQPEIVVEAPEPRFVAPTRRDRIGRIWAPVLINGRGPFRLVLDTGANRSGITAQVAEQLGLVPDTTRSVLLRGVTGVVPVPTVHADTFAVGDLIETSATLPIVTDALGGADGVLGTEGLEGMRLYIDFEHDRIVIARSHLERVPPDFTSIALERSPGRLLITRARVGDVFVRAVIDTGGQATIGNMAMRRALVSRHVKGTGNQVFDVTATSQAGEAFLSPSIQLGSITIQNARITYGDMHIFGRLHLAETPALLIGMDVIGLLDTLVIDYRRHELEIRRRTH